MLQWFLVTFLGTAHLAIAAWVCGHILLHKEESGSAVLWIGIVLLSPFVGSIFYAIFGINRVHRRATRLRLKRGPDPRPLQDPKPDRPPLPFLEQMRLMYQFGRSIHFEEYSPNNTIEPLLNGDQAFPAMLEAIGRARKSVALSTYIFNLDRAGKQFADALVQARERGVAVRVLVDDVGLRYSRRSVVRALKKQGVRAVPFLPTLTTRFIRFANLRNHRKILLVDGDTGFVGGMNIKQENLLAEFPEKGVRDIHFRVQGPVLDQMKRVFEDDWEYACGEDIALPPWQGSPGWGTAETAARFIFHGPDNQWKKLHWLFLGALNLARKNIRIVTPYFLPTEILLNALQAAAMRGVQVDIVLPRKSNIPFLAWGMEANFLRLLESGIHIFRTSPPFDHSKIFVMDDIWASVGSSNWDSRSFRLNFEANLECFDPGLARELIALIEEKKREAEPVTRKEMRNLKLFRRLGNNFVRLFTPFL